MRLAVFILILTSISALGSEGVMVDSELVKPGDIIYSNSNKINIPETGYSAEGYPHLLTKKARVAALMNGY
jgi:hypothetical protein